MVPNTAVILVNIGTPDSPSVKDVRKYLRQFLGDKRVITLPWLWRKMLVNLIISPFRGPKSSKLYQSIWTPDGSPLLVNSLMLSEALNKELGSWYNVFVAMRYGNPGLEEVIGKIAPQSYKRIILVPLYPQYADSTTGTTIAYMNDLVKKYKVKARVSVVKQFFEEPEFIAAFQKRIEAYNPTEYDHILFSFHGLPVKQTEKMHPGFTCEQLGCMKGYHETNALCYRAACYETARLLINAVKLSPGKSSVAFQSRFGKDWLEPYTDEVLKTKAAQGVKRILIISPAFVADCLETIYELGIEYKHLFINHGGEELTLVPSLNDDAQWVKGLKEMIER